MVKNHKFRFAKASLVTSILLRAHISFAWQALQKYMELQANFMSYACLMSLVNI